MYNFFLLVLNFSISLALHTFRHDLNGSDTNDSLSKTKKRQASCPVDDLPCVSPLSYEETKQFLCNGHCPEGHLCCEDSCFVHRICKPVISPTGDKETNTENCPAEKFSCREQLVPVSKWTKLACVEGKCPKGYMCCPDSCFYFNVCKKIEPKVRNDNPELKTVADRTSSSEVSKNAAVLNTGCIDSRQVYNFKRRQYYPQYHHVRHYQYHYIVNNPSRYFNPVIYPGTTSAYKCGNDGHCPPCHKCFHDLFYGCKVCKKCCKQDGTTRSTSKTTEELSTTSAKNTSPTSTKTTTTEIITSESTTTEPTTSTTTVTTTELTSTIVEDTTTETTTTTSPSTTTEATEIETITSTEVLDTTTVDLTTAGTTGKVSTTTSLPTTTREVITTTDAEEMPTTTAKITSTIPLDDNDGSGNENDDEDDDDEDNDDEDADGENDDVNYSEEEYVDPGLEAGVEIEDTTAASNVFKLFK